MSWWSEYYKRPLKDPLLLQYSVEELAYEYFSHSERRRVEEERIQQQSDKIDEDKDKAAQEWADLMEKEEDDKDPTTDPENVKWMQEQIKLNKKKYGDDFGEDLSIDFSKDE